MTMAWNTNDDDTAQAGAGRRSCAVRLRSLAFVRLWLRGAGRCGPVAVEWRNDRGEPDAVAVGYHLHAVPLLRRHTQPLRTAAEVSRSGLPNGYCVSTERRQNALGGRRTFSSRLVRREREYLPGTTRSYRSLMDRGSPATARATCKDGAADTGQPPHPDLLLGARWCRCPVLLGCAAWYSEWRKRLRLPHRHDGARSARPFGHSRGVKGTQGTR